LPDASDASGDPPSADTRPGAVVPALVLNVGRLVLHHGGVGIIRSLGRMGVPVYATVEHRWTPAAVSRYLAGAFVWDTRGLEATRFLAGMRLIGKQINRRAVLIPTGDDAAILIAEHAAELREWFIIPRQPPSVPRSVANKRELYRLCEKAGVACPKSVFPTCADDVRRFAVTARFPVIVKAAEAWELPVGGRSTVLAVTPEKLLAIYEATDERRRSNLIIQEFIDPLRGADWFFHGYRNDESDLCIGFTGRKHRSYPPLCGPTTLGRSVTNLELRRQAEVLLQTLSYGGIVDMDFRFDGGDSRYKLLDFNPRIGAQFRLFETEAGIDVARALYLDMTGQGVPSAEPVDDRVFIAELHDIAASVGYSYRGLLTGCEWRRSLQGRREFAWFHHDDLRPFFMMGVHLVLRVAARFLRLRPSPPDPTSEPRYSGQPLRETDAGPPHRPRRPRADLKIGNAS
jgi:predicted ATP-grasp superfamily ATP-dependent carboligase